MDPVIGTDPGFAPERWSGALLAVRNEIVSCTLGNDAVVLDPRSGVYYGLNEVAARVFSLLSAPRTFEQLVEDIVAEYDVSASNAESDLRTLLSELIDRRLVELRDANPR